MIPLMSKKQSLALLIAEQTTARIQMLRNLGTRAFAHIKTGQFKLELPMDMYCSSLDCLVCKLHIDQKPFVCCIIPYLITKNSADLIVSNISEYCFNKHFHGFTISSSQYKIHTLVK